MRSPGQDPSLGFVPRDDRARTVWSAATKRGVAAGNIPLKPFSAAVIGSAFLAVHNLTPLRLPIGDWRVWVAGFVAVEFVYYWFHRRQADCEMSRG